MPAVGGNMVMWSTGPVVYSGTFGRRNGATSATLATPFGQDFALPHRRWAAFGSGPVYHIEDVVMAASMNASAGGLGPIPGWHVYLPAPTKNQQTKEGPKEGEGGEGGTTGGAGAGSTNGAPPKPG